MLNDSLSMIYPYRVENSGEHYLYWRNLVWKILVDDFFKKYINPTDTVLDIPTGFGEFINNIKCKEKIAADINPYSKKYLKNNIKFICGSSTKIDLADGRVDKVFCSNFFEHINHQEIIKTIKEFKRILRLKGRVLVFQPNIRFLRKDYWRFFDHITPIDDRGLEEAFGLCGFKLIYRIEQFFPFTVKSTLPKSTLLVRLYLHTPFLWKIFGEQSFLIFEKQKGKL